MRTSYSRQTLLAELSAQPLGHSLLGGHTLPSDSSCAMSFFSAPFVEKVVFALLSQIFFILGFLRTSLHRAPTSPNASSPAAPFWQGRALWPEFLGLIGKTLNDEDTSTRQIPMMKGRVVCWIGLGMGGKWFSVQGYQGVTSLQISRMGHD